MQEFGTCYEEAWRFLIKQEEGELVHGTVLSLGKRIGHAWVELPTGYIWEPQTKSFFRYNDFQAAAEPIEEHRYTGEQAAIMVARVGRHGPWTEEEKEEFLKGGNPERVRFDRADIDSAIAAAKRLLSMNDLYIFATHLGYTIDHRPPPGIQSYVIVHPDGSTETIKPTVGGNPMQRRIETARKSTHERIFGKGSPLEKLGIGKTDNELMPMPPESGPPLPRGWGIHWPWKK